MKRLVVVLLLVVAALQSYATHYRAGELTFTVKGYLLYDVVVTTYTTDIYGSNTPDNDTVNIQWGDGTSSPAFRINGSVGPSGFGMGQSLLNGIKVNIYKPLSSHQYPGPLPYYLISVSDPNRIQGILNINGGSSVEVQFYIEDTLRVFNPAFNGYDNSPVLLYPPIDYGNVNDTFIHNPAAYDPDGDSLTFELIPCKQKQGQDVPNYVLPDQVLAGINNKITIDSRTGVVTWATPQREGPYNIAILVREYRGGILLGTVLRDMQIIIKRENNDPPQIAALHDTCVVAGADLKLHVTATDPNPGQTITLSAAGGPFDVSITNKATFTSTSAVDFVSGDFDWQTNCKNIRAQFYEIVFKAVDNYVQGPLVDLETWIVKVVGPGPENLQANAQGNVVNLTWKSPYACDASKTSTFIGFSVWRREGPNPYVVDTCSPGLAGHGYIMIKDLTTDYFFTDSAVHRGKVYCYRIQAEFAETTPFGLHYNQVPSLPSNEACANLKIDLPLITAVSVDKTDTVTGKITVVWEKPIVDALNFDTIQHPGPYRFVLFRSQGFTGTLNQVQLHDVSTPFFASFSDTVYHDSLLNTVDNPYNYLVDFYSNGTKLGSSEPASSVFLNIARQDRSLLLTWADSVPWLNNRFVIYRQNPVTTVYDSIDTSNVQSYTNYGLINDSLYCYKVKTIGRYTVPGLQDPIINLSQEVCQRPHDTIPPCPPVLQVSNPCTNLTGEDNSCTLAPDQLKNTLTWTHPADSCGHDTRKYTVYFASPNGAVKHFVVVDSILNGSDTTFKHSDSSSLAGCYVVTATDTAGNESVFSNEVCIDNCPCYQLPNVFTPNGDSHNDLYTPIEPYRFVAKVEMKIFNRWGDLIFETNDPNINWNGNDKNGKPVPEDTYYYSCKVYEQRVQGIVQNKNVLSGFIHLIRGNGGSNK